MNTEVSDTLKTYLGSGESGGYLPYGHEERMSTAYGDNAVAKISQIREYLAADHCAQSHSDLGQEQKVFEIALAQRFPELDAIAINALACRWSYSRR